jgi:hypothetical protein
MTDNNNLKHDSSSNMEAVKTAILNGKEAQLKMLLTNLVFDELQKGYLINLAEQSGRSEIVKFLKDSPATP